MVSNLKSLSELACNMSMGSFYYLNYANYSYTIHGIDALLDDSEIGEDNLQLRYPRPTESIENTNINIYIDLMLYEVFELALKYYEES